MNQWVCNKTWDAPITLTKLIAIREGLKLAVQLQCEKLMIESDSKVAVELIQHSEVHFHMYGQVIFDCRSFLQQIPHTKMKHIHRDSNFGVDFLANFGHLLTSNLIFCLKLHALDWLSCEFMNFSSLPKKEKSYEIN